MPSQSSQTGCWSMSAGDIDDELNGLGPVRCECGSDDLVSHPDADKPICRECLAEVVA